MPYIDAHKIFVHVDNQQHLSKGKLLNYIKEHVISDVEQIKQGMWIKSGNKRECSICKFFYFDSGNFNFCPNCGAKNNLKKAARDDG